MKLEKIQLERFVQTFLEHVDSLPIPGVAEEHQWLSNVQRIWLERQREIDAFFKELVNVILIRTSDWSAEEVARADNILNGKDALTLSAVRIAQNKRVVNILKRSQIRNALEYYFVREVVDSGMLDVTSEAFLQLDGLLTEFEANF